MDKINFIILVKGEECYLFLYTEEQCDELRRAFGRFAANPALTLDWHDAAHMATKVQQLRQED